MKTPAKNIAPLTLSLCLAACAGPSGKSGSSDSTSSTTAGSTTGSTTTALTGSGTGSTTGSTTGGTTGGSIGQDGTVVVKTAQVVVTPSTANAGAGTTAVSLDYAILRNSTTPKTPAQAWALTIASYDPYGWGLRDNYAGHPNIANILGLYLQNQTAGTVGKPAIGTYTVQTPAAGATGMFIDPAISGYEVFASSCTGSYPLLASGGTVTLTAVDSTGTVVSGSLNLTLQDPSGSGAAYATVTGTFTTSPAVTGEASGAPATATECAW